MSEEWGTFFSGCGQISAVGGSLEDGIFFSEGLRVFGCMVFVSEPIFGSNVVSGLKWSGRESYDAKFVSNLVLYKRLRKRKVSMLYLGDG